jgi:hypothetical protein
MALAPNGDLLVANSDVINSDPNQPSEIVEFTTSGRFVKQLSVDPQQGGSFGLAVATSRGVARFAAVDDVTGTLLIWTLPFPLPAERRPASAAAISSIRSGACWIES